MVKNQATQEEGAGVLEVDPTPGRCVRSCCMIATGTCNSQARKGVGWDGLNRVKSQKTLKQ